MLFTRLLNRLGRRHPTIVPLPEPQGSPGSQTSLGMEQRTAISTLSKSLGSPAPQTSLSTSSHTTSLDRMPTELHLSVFQLPDELILSILSHISPDPRVTGHCAWFRIAYRMEISKHHNWRMDFLRRLSMTCRVMWLRLVPWMWERIELPISRRWDYGESFAGKLNAITNILHTEVFLATSIRYFCALLCP